MNDIFAGFYETFLRLYDEQFYLIFNTLYDNGSYTFLGLTFIGVPLVVFAHFYLLWKYPYGNFWHWFLWLSIAFIIAGGISWGILDSEIFLSDTQLLIDALADPKSRYEEYANTLHLKYTLLNGLLGMMAGFIWSLMLKRFSKIQIHLPF